MIYLLNKFSNEQFSREMYMTTQYIKSQIDNKNYCKTNGQFTRHLLNNNLTYQEYYEKYITKKTPKCHCGQPLTFYQRNHSYANSCGSPVCVGKSISNTKKSWTDEKRTQDSKNKQKAAKLRTDEDISATVNKSKKTFIEKYGVEWVTQSPQYKDKSKKTKLARYGNEYYANSNQTSLSWQAKTADEINAIVDKRRATCLDRFGVENAFLKPEVRSKSAKANSLGKDYTLPSGRIIRVRGYEHIAILELLKTYSEDELVLDDTRLKYNLPVFKYTDKSRNSLRYYPDIYIQKENKIIEVKSRWWWDGLGNTKYKNRLNKNLNKRQSVTDAGYQYEVWLFEDKNNYRILKNDSDFA
jgi:hypothetical protein